MRCRERRHRGWVVRCRGFLFAFRAGLELLQPFRVAGKSDSVSIFLSLAGVAVDGGASVLEVRHKAAFGWAVGAWAVGSDVVRVRRGDLVAASIQFFSFVREVIEPERGPLHELKGPRDRRGWPAVVGEGEKIGLFRVVVGVHPGDEVVDRRDVVCGARDTKEVRHGVSCIIRRDCECMDRGRAWYGRSRNGRQINGMCAGMTANRGSRVLNGGGVFEVGCGCRDISEAVLHRLRVVRVHLVEGCHRDIVFVES